MIACVYLSVFWSSNEWTKVKWVTVIFLVGGVYSGLETCLKELKNIKSKKKMDELKISARSKMSAN
jgi:hypothetical protein